MSDAPRRLDLTRLGWALALPVLFLALVGLASIHATDRNETPATEPVDSQPAAGAVHWLTVARDAVGDTTVKQIGFFVSGGVLMAIVCGLGYMRIGRMAYPIYWLVIGMLILLLVDRYLVDLPLIKPNRNT